MSQTQTQVDNVIPSLPAVTTSKTPALLARPFYKHLDVQAKLLAGRFQLQSEGNQRMMIMVALAPFIFAGRRDVVVFPTDVGSMMNKGEIPLMILAVASFCCSDFHPWSASYHSVITREISCSFSRLGGLNVTGQLTATCKTCGITGKAGT